MKANPEVLEYMDGFPHELRAIMMRLRELIFEVVPDAGELMKWRVPTYVFRDRNVCQIAGYQKHASIVFFQGNRLNDPEGLLKGSGKYLRFMPYRSLQEVEDEPLRFWILEAFYS